MTTAVAAVVRALDTVELSGREVAQAYEAALDAPRGALANLRDVLDGNVRVNPRTQARYELAAEIVVRRQLIAAYPDQRPVLLLDALPVDDDGDRFYEPGHGRWRFTFVELPRDGVIGDVRPLVFADHERALDEEEFAAFLRDGALVQAAIDPTGCVRATAAVTR